MSDEVRSFIVSIRLSAGEQGRLRRKAESRGITVSELLRRAVLAETRAGAAATTTTYSASMCGGVVLVDGYGSPRPGVVWLVPDGAVAQGANLTI
jgi:hypothetical protein